MSAHKTMKYGTFSYDTVEVENGLKRNKALQNVLLQICISLWT